MVGIRDNALDAAERVLVPQRNYRMAVLGRTLEHLGVQMYKRRDTAIAELVANSWDANASNVWVDLPKENAEWFFELMTQGFGDLQAIAANESTAADIREQSLLLSTTMLRVIAGVYHDLKADGVADNAILTFFKKLDKVMKAPIVSGTPIGDLWLDATTTEAFTDGATAPGARSQQVKELVSVITGWYHNPPALLSK
jgi:hypothetical protein